MADREHPAVDAVQATTRDAASDPTGAEPVLACREVRDPHIERGVRDVSSDIGTFRRGPLHARCMLAKHL
jgi:hypothetical protein